MSEFKSSNFRNEDGSGGPDIVGVTTFTSPYYFVPPSGTTAERPSDPPPGMLRFNEDIGRLEVWRNDHWATILGEPSSPIGGRGLFGGGGGFDSPTTPNTARIDYVTIATTGNGIDFGDLTQARSTYQGRASSTTRGIWGGGYVNSPLTPTGPSNIIDYVEIPTLGDAQDFGDLSGARFGVGGHSDATRGLFGGGNSPSTSTIDKITISSTGSTASFGNLSLARRIMGCCGSPTRAVWGGGEDASDRNEIDYVTIQSDGTAQDFGDLKGAYRQVSALSSTTRGIFTSLGNPGTTNFIEYITISSTGDAQDFGDLYQQVTSQPGTTSNSTRGIVAGGSTPAGRVNTIQFITIATTGDAQDFGDLTQIKNSIGACSNAHGGL